MNPVRFATLAVLLAIISVASPAYGGPIVVFDGTFNNNDWTQTATVDPAGSFFTATATQILTGGNPGAFREMTHTWGGPGEAVHVTLDHMYNLFTYDPKTQGAIGSINYSEDGIILSSTFPSSVVGRGMDIFQDGVVYRTFASNGGFYALTDTTWTTFSLTGLTATDFGSSSGTHPNFSATGDPMQFGYLRSNGLFGLQTIVNGIDNWTVTINPVPEPSSLWLAIIGGLGLIAAWRRTRKPAVV